MKRIIGIVLIVIGIVVVAVAFSSHEEDKTLLDLGKIEIKKQDKSPSNNTAVYYVIAGVCLLAGGIMVGKKS